MCVLALWSRAYDGAQVPEGEEGRAAVGQVPDGGGDHGPGHLTTSATSTAMIVTKTNKKITLDATLSFDSFQFRWTQSFNKILSWNMTHSVSKANTRIFFKLYVLIQNLFILNLF